MKVSTGIKGAVAALFTILVWGVTFVNTRSLLAQFSALEIQVLRFAIGYAALCVLTIAEARNRHCSPFVLYSRKDECLCVLMGLFGVAVYQLLENCAIHYTNASNVSILVCMCPLLTAVVARFVFPGNRLGLRFLVGFVIAITGVVMVSMNGVSEFHFNPLGDALAAGAMLSWVVYSNLVTVMNRRGIPQVTVIRRMFFWTLVTTLPLVVYGTTDGGRLAMEGSFAVSFDPAVNATRFTSVMNYVNLGFLGLLASAACFVLWNKALAIVGTVRCTVGLYLLPAITVVFAYLFLGETLSPVSAVGAVLILAGVVLSGMKHGTHKIREMKNTKEELK